MLALSSGVSRKRGRLPLPYEMDTSLDSLNPILAVPISQSASKALKRVRKNTQPGELRLLRDLEDLAGDEISGRIRLKFAAPTAIEATLFLDSTSIVSVLVLIDRYYPHKAPQVHCLAFGNPSSIGRFEKTREVSALANSFPSPKSRIYIESGGSGSGGKGDMDEEEEEEEEEEDKEMKEMTLSSVNDSTSFMSGARMMIPIQAEQAPSPSPVGMNEEVDDAIMDGLLAAFSGAFSDTNEGIGAGRGGERGKVQPKVISTSSLSSSSDKLFNINLDIHTDQNKEKEKEEEEEEEEEEKKESTLVVLEIGKRVELPILTLRTWSPVFTLKQILESVAEEAKRMLYKEKEN